MKIYLPNIMKKSRKVFSSKPSIPWMILAFSLLSLLIVIPIILFLDTLEPSDTIEGRIIGLFQPQTEWGSRTEFVIRLNDGRTIHLGSSRLGTFRQGRAVLVQEYRSKILGRSEFQFMKYVDVEMKNPHITTR
jgi:hypothetical protein